MATHYEKYNYSQNNFFTGNYNTLNYNTGFGNSGCNWNGSIWNSYFNPCCGFDNYNPCGCNSASNTFLTYLGAGLGNMCANLCYSLCNSFTSWIGGLISGGGSSSSTTSTSSDNPEVTKLNEKIEANLEKLGVTSIDDIANDVEASDCFDEYKETKADLKDTISAYKPNDKSGITIGTDSLTNGNLANASNGAYNDAIDKLDINDVAKANLKAEVNNAIETQKALKEAAKEAQEKLDTLEEEHTKLVELAKKTIKLAEKRDKLEKEDKEKATLDEATEGKTKNYNDLFDKYTTDEALKSNAKVKIGHIRKAFKDYANLDDNNTENKETLAKQIKILVNEFGIGNLTSSQKEFYQSILDEYPAV